MEHEAEQIRKRMEDLNIDADLVPSPLKVKRWRLIFSDEKKIDFGSKTMDNFLIHKDEVRRQRFLNRWKNNKYINDKERPLYYSVNLLW